MVVLGEANAKVGERRSVSPATGLSREETVSGCYARLGRWLCDRMGATQALLLRAMAVVAMRHLSVLLRQFLDGQLGVHEGGGLFRHRVLPEGVEPGCDPCLPRPEGRA
jgi:hypothetical protein